MALPDPLPVEAFADLFKVQDVEFVQNFNQQSSMTGGGERRYADRAPAMIRAKITTIPMLNAEAEGIMALINSRAGGLKKALLYNYRLPYPATDPGGVNLDSGSITGPSLVLDFAGGTGEIFSASSVSPRIRSIADRLHVAFERLPSGYVLPVGTYFSIVFDTSRYYLGQIAEQATANSSGATGTVEIWPPLPASITGTPSITLKKPPAKFTIVPNSAFPSKEGGMHSTIEFAAEQTYSR